MDNENEFNISSDYNFKKASVKKSGGFKSTVFVPFVSGVIGATLVIGTCFGVPSIKEKLVGQRSTITSSITAPDGTKNVINIVDYSNTATAVAEKILPSIVGITVNYQTSSIFGGTSNSSASGSGIIISEDGYIVTNNHVISTETSSFYSITEATGIEIKLYNDTETYTATVVGTDAYSDLAVLKIEKTGLTPATIGNSDNLKVGEFVMAVGNPLGMDYTVTCGIVSALNREVEVEGTMYETIQTDAAINSGNSGGALVNANGDLVGINTVKVSGNGVEGIGFAIPISSATGIIDQLIEHKEVKRPYIGISGSSVDPNITKRYNIPEGIYVEEVQKDSAAEKAGLKQGDIITKIQGESVKSINELNKIKYTYNIGDTVKLTVYRNGSEIELDVTLTELIETETSETQKEQPIPQTQDDFGGTIFDLFR